MKIIVKNDRKRTEDLVYDFATDTDTIVVIELANGQSITLKDIGSDEFTVTATNGRRYRAKPITISPISEDTITIKVE
ncbi:hypothetical protein SE17_08535 [Kouleothrix aurantiaca]|uniref:Uncharacterized protein n=1 Tax=Kouleothrix aurantiaca TaxID=186479 RepID=A0A0N8PST7_9CHLR|nr:hypothetical protein SE17_08535 [Kouleothrix aurantiaca]